MRSQWRHNECGGVPIHRRHGCLLNSLFRRRSKTRTKLCVTGLCEGNPPVTGGFPSQRASNAENDSIWWRHQCQSVPTEWYQGLYSQSGKTSYPQISWSLEATRLNVIIAVSLWNLTGTSAAALPMCLLNFRAIGKVQTRISRLRDFTRSCSKTSYRLVNRGPGSRVFFYWYRLAKHHRD